MCAYMSEGRIWVKKQQHKNIGIKVVEVRIDTIYFVITGSCTIQTQN